MERLPVCPQASGTGEEAMVSVVCSYDDLSRKLWNLKELPLTVTAVQGVHPAFRYTDVSVPGRGRAWGSAASWGVPWGEGGPRESVTHWFCGSREPLRRCGASSLLFVLCVSCAQADQTLRIGGLCWCGRFG